MEGILEKVLDGSLPPHAKRALVQGVFPLDVEELFLALYYLCREDPQLLDDARKTFGELPDGSKEALMSDRKTESKVLFFYMVYFSLPKKAKQAGILNANTPAEALDHIAPRLEADLLDVFINNQTKIKERPSIVEALRKNKNLTIIQSAKLEEYGRLLLQDLVSPAEELEEKSIEEIEAEAVAEAKEHVRVYGRESKPEEEKAEAKKKTAKKTPLAKEKIAQKASEEEDEEKQSTIKMLAGMSVPQKVQAAIKGDREVRSYLIRDSNKLVCSAVLKSPKITEAEVEFYSNLRNIQADVLRLICLNREWLKSYKIVLNLVKNPRTPLTFSMKFISRLNKHDIRSLVRDRGVPEVLRKVARKKMRDFLK